MFRKTKYVVGLAKIGLFEKVVAVIFSEDIIHADMAMRFFGSPNRIISGGFCDVLEREGHATTMKVYGDSVSLNVKSRPEDELYLNDTMGLSDEPVPGTQQRQDYDAIVVKIQAANALLGKEISLPDSLPSAANE